MFCKSPSPLKIDGFHQHSCRPAFIKPKFFGRSRTQIDDPSVDEWPAIVDPQDDLSVVVQVGYAHEGRKRQVLVRRIKTVGIELGAEVVVLDDVLILIPT